MKKNLIIFLIILISLIFYYCDFNNEKVKYDVSYHVNEFGLIKEPVMCYVIDDDLGFILNSDSAIVEGKETKFIDSFYKKNVVLQKLLDSLSNQYVMNSFEVGIRRINNNLMIVGTIVEFRKNEDSVLVYGFCSDSSEYQISEITNLDYLSPEFERDQKTIMKEVEKIKKIKNYLVTVYIRKRVE